MKRPINPILIIGVIVLLLVIAWVGLFSDYKPPVNWREYYTADKSTPFGTSLIKDRLDDLFPDVPVQEVKDELFSLFYDTTYEDQLLILVNRDVPLDSFDVNKMLAFVYEGNQVFLSAINMPSSLASFLELDEYRTYDRFDAQMWYDSVAVKTTGESARTFRFPHKHLPTTFVGELPGESRVLATSGDDEPVFIWVPYGEGAMWLSLYPQVMTNYYLVDSSRSDFLAYTLGSISPPKGILWDEYYKIDQLANASRRRSGDDSESDRPYTLKEYLAQKPALAWGIGLLVSSFLIFVLFESKRLQRLIPKRLPPPNTTLEFAETMGRLYFQHRDHRNLAEKMIQSWRDFVSTRFFVQQADLTAERVTSDENVAVLAAKSGMPYKEVKRMVRLIQRIHQQEQISDESLILLHDSLSEFYAYAKQ